MLCLGWQLKVETQCNARQHAVLALVPAVGANPECPKLLDELLLRMEVLGPSLSSCYLCRTAARRPRTELASLLAR